MKPGGAHGRKGRRGKEQRAGAANCEAEREEQQDPASGGVVGPGAAGGSATEPGLLPPAGSRSQNGSPCFPSQLRAQ